MIKIKKDAFTLSEVLITLAIVGTIALLVVPGLVKDVNNKAMMALLQGTVTNINDIVQTELSNTHVSKLEDTMIFKDPEKFLQKLDYTKSQGSGALIYYPDNGYITVNRATASGIGGGTYNASVILKNGVGIGLLAPRSANGTKYNGRSSALFNIDLNGAKEPNMVGVDLFELELSNESDYDEGIHVGDNLENSDDLKTNLTDCKNGKPYACYSAVTLSGFEPNYLFKED